MSENGAHKQKEKIWSVNLKFSTQAKKRGLLLSFQTQNVGDATNGGPASRKCKAKHPGSRFSDEDET